MLIFWVSKGSLKVKVYYIEVMRILLLVLTFRILESWCSVSQLHFLRLREHRRRIIGSHENLGYRELLEAIWSSLLLGSGLISNWIMSPRDLSNQVLKNLQGQFPTVFRQPVPVLGHSHCTFFFPLKSNFNFPSAHCDYGFFAFTVHPCEVCLCIFCNSPLGKRMLQTDTPSAFRLIKLFPQLFLARQILQTPLNHGFPPLDCLQFVSISQNWSTDMTSQGLSIRA